VIKDYYGSSLIFRELRNISIKLQGIPRSTLSIVQLSKVTNLKSNSRKFCNNVPSLARINVNATRYEVVIYLHEIYDTIHAGGI